MRKLGTLVLGMTLSFSPFALADHQPGHSTGGDHCERHMDLSKADKNGDGFVDKQEAAAMQQQHFDEADTNHDGKLSKEEVQACQRKGMKSGSHDKGSHAFMDADKDNDGTLDREEAKKLPRVAKNFDAIDTDKDGTVSREEVHQYMKDHPAK